MSIYIVKIKLLNNGMKGLEYHAEAPEVKQNVIIKAFYKINYPIPVPTDVKDTIQRMKRYLLHLSGHWEDTFDQYLLKGEVKDIADGTDDYYRLIALLQSTRIEELSRFKGKYDILGFFINKWKLPIPIQIKGITIDTGYEDYDKLDRGMKHIFQIVTDFIQDKDYRKMDSRQYMMDLWGAKADLVEKIDSLDDDQIDELQAEIMEQKGYIVIKQEEEPEVTTDEKDTSADKKSVIEPEVAEKKTEPIDKNDKSKKVDNPDLGDVNETPEI